MYWGLSNWGYDASSWTDYVGFPQHKFDEKDGVITLRVLMAGAKKAGIRVYVKENKYLCISYVDGKGGDFYDFDKEWVLSDSIDQEGIESEYKDGVLVVTLPKKKSTETEIKVK